MVSIYEIISKVKSEQFNNLQETLFVLGNEKLFLGK
jgi:hypothetical protein